MSVGVFGATEPLFSVGQHQDMLLFTNRRTRFDNGSINDSRSSRFHRLISCSLRTIRALSPEPELSNLEKDTAPTVANHLRKLKVFDIFDKIGGGHGLAAVWKNCSGKTVLLRADMDALPIVRKLKGWYRFYS